MHATQIVRQRLVLDHLQPAVDIAIRQYEKNPGKCVGILDELKQLKENQITGLQVNLPSEHLQIPFILDRRSTFSTNGKNAPRLLKNSVRYSSSKRSNVLVKRNSLPDNINQKNRSLRPPNPPNSERPGSAHENIQQRVVSNFREHIPKRKILSLQEKQDAHVADKKTKVKGFFKKLTSIRSSNSNSWFRNMVQDEFAD